MFRVFIESFAEAVKKPLLLAPALIVMLANVLVLFLALDNYFGFFYDVFVFNNVPGQGLLDTPYYMITTYGVDILAMALASIIALALGFYLLYVFAEILAGKEKKVFRAMASTLSRAGEILALAFFAGIAAFLYIIVAYILLLITFSVEALGIITLLLLILWLIFGLYAYFKFVFTPVFMAVERKKLKEALKVSWKWSAGKLASIIVFLVILSFVTALITNVGIAISDSLSVDWLIVLALAITAGLSGAYYNIALIKYFQAKK